MHRDEPEKITDLYNSLRLQTRKPDEWIILLNGEAAISGVPVFDSAFQIRYPVTTTTGNIGALKREACAYCTGDVFVEVDYDDMLTPDAIEKIEQAFLVQHVRFVYSNSVEFLPDGQSNIYSQAYGWQHRPYGEMLQNVAFPATAQYLRRIEWAPNHVRAFRSDAYKVVGGYNESLPVGDDHDLCCRFYLEYGEQGFHHIDECLYLYRVHTGNTSGGQNRNAEVQAQVDANYCNHAEKMYLRWAKDEGLDCFDLGGRFNCPEGYNSVDLLDADMIADLTKPWPIEDNSVGVIRAYHLLEHLPDTIHFFNEAFRVLAPGGFLLIEVPSVTGPGAFGDPTHVKFFNLLSFEYFTNQEYARYIQPQYAGRFQKARVSEYRWPNGIPVISAQLIALKGWYDENWCGLKEM